MVFSTVSILFPPDLEETEHFVLYYNLALTAFLQKKFTMAQKILNKVHSALSQGSKGSPGAPSNLRWVAYMCIAWHWVPPHICLCFSPEAQSFLYQKVAPLLVAACLALKQPNNALNCLNALGPAGGTAAASSPGYMSSARPVLDRAQALVQAKQHKAFKRDIKANGTMSGHCLTAYEFLRQA